jgi:hypothetical protein
MIAARIGPTGREKLPIADALVAEAVGADITCATVVLRSLTGCPVVVLDAAAARRDAPRNSRLAVDAAIHITGSAAEPVPPDIRDATERGVPPLTEPAAAGVTRTASDLPAVEAADVGPEWEPRSRETARVTEGDDDADRTLEPADPAASVVSAKAAGAEAKRPPTPRATARAPTRPT